MILVNETYRMTKDGGNQSVYGVQTINSLSKDINKCSWSCYYNTTYCKAHHTKHLKPYFNFIDPIYFLQIKFLHSFGNYALANIVFMVILWPLVIYLLLINSLNMHQRIKEIKK